MRIHGRESVKRGSGTPLLRAGLIPVIASRAHSCQFGPAMSTYAILQFLHLLCALLFVGTVFFEVLILESVRRHVPREVMRQVESGIGLRARRLMPWVLLVLYGSGIGMAWRYRGLLAHPLESSFALMLTAKIVLALSVLGHFLFAMHSRGRGRLFAALFRRLHVSLFWHMLAIVLLAKLMFHLSW